MQTIEQVKKASQAVARLVIDARLSNPPKAAEILGLLVRAEELGYARCLEEAPRPPKLVQALQHIAYEPLGHPEASDRECLDEATRIAKEALAT